jgi:hypothetical protein
MFTVEAHKDQRRKSGETYIHLLQCKSVASEIGLGDYFYCCSF